METRAHLAWRIQNVQSGEADIDIFDVIGDPWGEGTTANDFVKELRALKGVSKINLHINSPGGYINDALAMYAAIQEHPAKVTARITFAASAATFVAMAADTILLHKNAQMFIHDAHGFAMGNAADMRLLADMLDEESQNIASIYSERAGGTSDEWRDRMRANDGVGTAYRGQAAVDIGLVDELFSGPTKNELSGRIAALSTDTPTPPAIDLAAAMNAARRTSPAPTLQQLLEQHQKEPLTAAIKGA